MQTYRPSRARIQLLVAPLVALCLVVPAGSASAAAGSHQPIATTDSIVLRADLTAYTAAGHSFALNKKSLKRCRRVHPIQCGAKRRAVRRSRIRLAKAERRVHSLTANAARRHMTNTATQAPTSTGTQAPAPTGTQAPTLTGTQPPTLAGTKIPTLTVSGQTLAWNPVSGVNSYVFVRKVPGQADQYTIIANNSTTPTAVPGATVRYSVRTAVVGSSWAPEVTISYPPDASNPPPTAPPVTSPSEPVAPPSEPVAPPSEPGSGTSPESPPATEGSTAGDPFTMGVVAGASLSYELPFIEKLGSHTARMEFKINTPASQMAPTIEAYAKAGIQPLLLASFYGRLPSPEEARNLASWAAEFGPGGTLWKGKSFPAGTAVVHIEFGNETSYTYQFSNNSTSEYASRAQTYALRVKEAQEAIQASNSSVGILAQADSGGLSGNAWVANMFKVVPNLGQFVAGWTVHPYGSAWQTRLDQLVAGTAAVGAPSSIPIYATEWGLDTDNGRCLEYNYGWNKCMSYEEAASTLSSSVSAMRARYGSRLAAIYLYEAHDQQPTGTATALESYFGALQSNGNAKGAYTTEVKSLLSTNP